MGTRGDAGDDAPEGKGYRALPTKVASRDADVRPATSTSSASARAVRAVSPTAAAIKSANGTGIFAGCAMLVVGNSDGVLAATLLDVQAQGLKVQCAGNAEQRRQWSEHTGRCYTLVRRHAADATEAVEAIKEHTGQADGDCVQVVTLDWLKECLALKLCLNPSRHVIFKPSAHHMPLAGFAQLRVSISQYTVGTGARGQERRLGIELVQILGAKYKETFNGKTCTHLITPVIEGSKCKLALSKGVPMVTFDWLYDCYRKGALLDTAPYRSPAGRDDGSLPSGEPTTAGEPTTHANPGKCPLSQQTSSQIRGSNPTLQPSEPPPPLQHPPPPRNPPHPPPAHPLLYEQRHDQLAAPASAQPPTAHELSAAREPSPEGSAPRLQNTTPQPKSPSPMRRGQFAPIAKAREPREPQPPTSTHQPAALLPSAPACPSLGAPSARSTTNAMPVRADPSGAASVAGGAASGRGGSVGGSLQRMGTMACVEAFIESEARGAASLDECTKAPQPAPGVQSALVVAPQGVQQRRLRRSELEGDSDAFEASQVEEVRYIDPQQQVGSAPNWPLLVQPEPPLTAKPLIVSPDSYRSSQTVSATGCSRTSTMEPRQQRRAQRRRAGSSSKSTRYSGGCGQHARLVWRPGQR